MAHNSLKSVSKIRMQQNYSEDYNFCFIPQNSVKAVSKVENYGCSEVEWTIKNWNDRHKIVVAAEASCFVKIGSPEVEIRFFLRPKENVISLADCAFVSKWYSLWAEVLTPHQNLKSGAINITAYVRSDDKLLLTKGARSVHDQKCLTLHSESVIKTCDSVSDGAFDINTSRGETVEVIDRFLSLDSCCLDSTGRFTDAPQSSFTYQRCEPGKVDITIKIKADLFRLIE